MAENDIVYDEPSEVRAVGGKVKVAGPDAVDVTLTPDAAERTSDRLLAEAFKARGQKRMEDYPHRANDE